MTFLDTGVVVKVVDSTVVNYRVQLSGNHFAYLPKANFKRDSSVSIKPYYLTGSWLVNGDDKYDYRDENQKRPFFVPRAEPF